MQQTADAHVTVDVSSQAAGKDEAGLPPAPVLAWLTWLFCALPPLVLMLAAIGAYGISLEAQRPVASMLVGLVAVLWLVLALPVAMVLRSHVLKRVISGAAVDEKRYLKSMATIWAAAAVAGLLSALSCLVGGAVLPWGLPWLVATMALGAFAPSKVVLGR